MPDALLSVYAVWDIGLTHIYALFRSAAGGYVKRLAIQP